MKSAPQPISRTGEARPLYYSPPRHHFVLSLAAAPAPGANSAVDNSLTGSAGDGGPVLFPARLFFRRPILTCRIGPLGCYGRLPRVQSTRAARRVFKLRRDPVGTCADRAPAASKISRSLRSHRRRRAAERTGLLTEASNRRSLRRHPRSRDLFTGSFDYPDTLFSPRRSTYP
jgi:hypothetical protein